MKKLEMMEYIARSALARMRTRNKFASMCWMRLRRRGSGYRPSSTLGSKSRGRPNVIVEMMVERTGHVHCATVKALNKGKEAVLRSYIFPSGSYFLRETTPALSSMGGGSV